jgi:dihydrofolate reductase
MRKLVVTNHVSLDGVMQAPSGPDEDARDGFPHGGWAVPFVDEVQGRRMGEGIDSSDALLLGRRTYEQFYGFWPQQTDGNPITDLLNKRHKYVVSTTLAEPLAWENSTLVDGDVPAAVAALKEQPGKDIGILGSGELIQSLLPHDLIDEFLLTIHPLVLGSGRRLFAGDGTYAAFELVHSTPTTTGVVMATYRRKNA